MPTRTRQWRRWPWNSSSRSHPWCLPRRPHVLPIERRPGDRHEPFDIEQIPWVDNGRFEILLEPFDAPDPAPAKRERRLRVWQG
jgi:hypothetical protein